MRLNEFYDPEQDQLNKIEREDTRKNRMTLEELQKLRKVRDIKAAEQEKYDEFASVMYAPPAQDTGPAL
jgi:hypothetical protein